MSMRIPCRWKAVVSSLAALLAALSLASAPAQAQVKPFKIVGVGVAPDGLPLPSQAARPHWIVGEATDLGRHTGEGSVQTDTAAPQPDGTIAGEFGGGSPFVFHGANGDDLACYYGRTAFGAAKPGTFDLTVVDVLDDGSLVVEAAFIAEFVVQPNLSTGKFAGATGSWVMYAYTEPFVLGSDDPLDYRWEGEGSLTFRKKH
jgi:hypothetical protein